MWCRVVGHGRRHAVAYLALFVALGGTSYAAVKLPANSVTSLQVKNGSLVRADFKAGTLTSRVGPPGARGPRGPQGVAGPQGATGAAGATNVVVRRTGPFPVAATTTFEAVAACQPGERAVGGGVNTVDADPASAGDGSLVTYVLDSRPEPPGVPTATGWRASVNNTSPYLIHEYVHVICVSP